MGDFLRLFDSSGRDRIRKVTEHVWLLGEERTVHRVSADQRLVCPPFPREVGTNDWGVIQAYHLDEAGHPTGVGVVVDTGFPLCMVCCREFTLFFRYV